VGEQVAAGFKFQILIISENMYLENFIQRKEIIKESHLIMISLMQCILNSSALITQLDSLSIRCIRKTKKIKTSFNF
jgi:hypothetical protein